MKIPGFTAEASFLKTTLCYQLVGDWKDSATDKSLVPQLGWLGTGAVMEAPRYECICVPHKVMEYIVDFLSRTRIPD